MSEAPQLLNLSTAAQSAYPNAPPAIAVVAYAQPSSLEDSMQQVADDNEVIGALKVSADRLFETAQKRSNESPSSVNLSSAAQISLDAESLQAEYQSSVKLARDVGELRSKLSRSMRIAVFAQDFLGYAGVSEAIDYVAVQRHSLPDNIYSYTIPSALSALVGAVLGYYTGKKLIGRTAQRRARVIASRMNTTEELPVYFPPGEETEANRVGTVKISGSERGKIVEATFLEEVLKSPKTIRSGVLLDWRARRVARRAVQAVAYRAEAQLGYHTAVEQHDLPQFEG